MNISFKHILLFLQLKLKILLNGFTKGNFKKRMRKFFALVGGAVFFIFIYIWAFDLLTVLANNAQIEMALIDNAIMIIFLAFFIFLLASGITISIHYLFISTDLPLLMSSPISDNTIFTFKLTEAIFANSSFFLFIGLPTFVAYGVVTQAHWFYYPLMLVNALCFLVIPVSISFLGALLIVRIIPASRARELMAVLLAVVSLGIWLALQIVRVSAFDRSSPDFNPDSIEQLGQISQQLFFNILPSSWAAKALTGLARADFTLIVFNFLPLLLFAGCIFYVCIKLSKNAFEKGLINSEQAVTVRKKNKAGKKRAIAPHNFAELFSGITGSIFLRDFRLFVRDSRQLTNMLMFAAMMIILPLIQNPDRYDSVFSMYQPYLFIVLFSAIVAAQLSSRLIPMEAKSFWITKLMPQSGLRIIWGKFLLCFSFSTILSWLAVIIISTYYGHPLRIKILALIATLAVSAALSSIGLLLGINFSRFDWDHPKRMLSSSGGLLLSLSTFVTIGVVGGIVALIYFIGGLLQLSPQFLDLAAVVAVIITVTFLVNIINFTSARKFESMEWLF